MDLLIDVILRAGRSAVELSFFILLPVMIVMISLMRLLEARGVLDWVVARLTPALRPLGLTGLGGFAALSAPGVSAPGVGGWRLHRCGQRRLLRAGTRSARLPGR